MEKRPSANNLLPRAHLQKEGFMRSLGGGEARRGRAIQERAEPVRMGGADIKVTTVGN